MDLKDEERHELLVGIWTMAWPALRARISFCDAPHTPRTLDDQPFDLQLQQTTRAGERDATEARILRGIPPAEPPVWAKHLAAETSMSGALSRFITDHGAQLEPSRMFVRPLVRLFDAYSSREATARRRAEAVVTILGEEFPKSKAGIALKTDLLTTTDEKLAVDDGAVLHALVTSREPEAFTSVELDIAERVRRLYASDIDSLWAMVRAIKDDRQPLADAVLTAMVDTAARDAFVSWSEQDPTAIRKLVKHNPATLGNADVWRVVDPDVLWSVAARQRGAKRRAAIVQAIVTAGISSLSEPVVTVWNTGADLLLSALSDATSLSTSDLAPWLAPIESQALLAFLGTVDDVTDAFAAAAVRDMDEAAIAAVGADRVKAALRGDPAIDIAIAAFLAALQRPKDAAWAEIGTTAYCRVVDRASKDELGRARERLRGIEPGLPEWDVVARVARAASKAFKDGRWPVEAALGIKERSAFAALVRADKHAGLARAMLVRVAAGGVSIKSWQKDIISSTIREKSDKDSLLKTIEGLARGIFRF